MRWSVHPTSPRFSSPGMLSEDVGALRSGYVEKGPSLAVMNATAPKAMDRGSSTRDMPHRLRGFFGGDYE
jgi:hypothetical protein